MGLLLTVMPFAQPMGASGHLGDGASINDATLPLRSVKFRMCAPRHQFKVFNPVVKVVSVNVVDDETFRDQSESLRPEPSVIVRRLARNRDGLGGLSRLRRGADVGGRVSVLLPPPIVHRAPAPSMCRQTTIRDRADPQLPASRSRSFRRHAASYRIAKGMIQILGG